MSASRSNARFHTAHSTMSCFWPSWAMSATRSRPFMVKTMGHATGTVQGAKRVRSVCGGVQRVSSETQGAPYALQRVGCIERQRERDAIVRIVAV